ncbi:MAG: M48 family metalloprotease [Candidatus Methylomirabilota bacterium]
MRWCMWCGGADGGWGRREFLLAAAGSLLGAGCGLRQAEGYSIYDEAGDVKIGREMDPSILRQFGYYDGPELQNYVAQIGQRVVSSADTRFSFQFKVVDHPSINAMALPGGFIYVTRGILAEMNDEAQLAGVLGHEVTHVNARHAAKLMTRALGTQIATIIGIGAAAATGSGAAATGIAILSSHVTNYMLLGYGRDFEIEADEVGLRYARRAGYDPRRTVTFFRALRRHELLRGQMGYHGFEASHPDTALRIAKADTMAQLLLNERGPLEIRADAFTAQLEGLRYGEAKTQLRLRIYTVRPGDTLKSVARAQLGDEGRRFEIASLNGLRDDEPLQAGSRLKLAVSELLREPPREPGLDLILEQQRK